jgi:plasmid maintenance system killer protein
MACDNLHTYTDSVLMVKNLDFEFANDDLARMYENGRHPQYHPNLVKAFTNTVALILNAKDERDVRAIKGKRMELLKGDRKDTYSVRLSESFRLIFSIKHDEEGTYILITEIVNYH